MLRKRLSYQRETELKLSQGGQIQNDFGFKTKSRHSDMTLKVGGDTLYVNQGVLKVASPVFKKIFGEKLQKWYKNEITLEEEDTEGFCEFLACFYPSCEHEIQMSNVFRILPLAYKYKVDRLMKKSVALLMKSLAENQADKHIYQCLSVAKQHSITTLEEKSMESLVDMYKTDVQRADEILTLKADIKPVVMSAMIPILRSEASRYRFLSAGLKEQDTYLDLDDFHDAKYCMVSFLLNHGKVAGLTPVEFTCTFTLWNVTLDIKPATPHLGHFGVGHSYYGLNLQTRDPIKYQYRAAIKMVFKTKKPGGEDICRQCQSPVQGISYTIEDLDSLGCRGNYNCTVEAHILMQKPKYTGEEDG